MIYTSPTVRFVFRLRWAGGLSRTIYVFITHQDLNVDVAKQWRRCAVEGSNKL